MKPARNKSALTVLFVMLTLLSIPCKAERADRDKPIQMEADRVTVDDPNQTSTFEGHVRLQQGTLLVEAGKIIVKQDKQGNSQITATGQLCHFRQKQDSTDTYAEGFGERIEYDSSAETLNIFGQARVKREGDDVRGEHIIYSTRTGVFQVFGSTAPGEKTDTGRVTIIIQPQSRKNAPPAGAASSAGKPSATTRQPH